MLRINHEIIEKANRYCFLSDNTLVTLNNYGWINVWDLTSGVVKNKWQLPRKFEDTSAFDPKEFICKATDKSFARRKEFHPAEIEIWDIESGNGETISTVGVGDAGSALFKTLYAILGIFPIGNGQLILTKHNSLHILDVTTTTITDSLIYNELLHGPGWHAANNFTKLPNGKIAFTIVNSFDNSHGIVIWNRTNNTYEFIQAADSKRINGFVNRINGLVFLSPQTLLLQSTLETIKLWDLSTNVPTNTRTLTHQYFGTPKLLAGFANDILVGFDNSHNGLRILNVATDDYFKVETKFACLDANENVLITLNDGSLVKIDIPVLVKIKNCLFDASVKSLSADVAYLVQGYALNQLMTESALTALKKENEKLTLEYNRKQEKVISLEKTVKDSRETERRLKARVLQFEQQVKDNDLSISEKDQIIRKLQDDLVDAERTNTELKSQVQQLQQQGQNNVLSMSRKDVNITELKEALAVERTQKDKQAKRIAKLESELKTEQQYLDSILLNAAEEGNLQRLRWVLPAANVDARDPAGMTALAWSLLNGHREVALHLLRYHADLTIYTNAGQSILDIMCSKGDVEAVKFILNNIPKDDPEAHFLLAAHERANAKELKQLIINTILHQAAKQGNIELVNKSLSMGADKNAQDDYQETALHKASYSAHTSVVKLLLEHRCSLHKANRHDQTAVDVAANNEIKKLFLDYQNKNAIIIQSRFRGFFHRKQNPLEKSKASRKEHIESLSGLIIPMMTFDESITATTKLETSLKEGRLHKAIQILRDKPEKDMLAASGYKVTY